MFLLEVRGEVKLDNQEESSHRRYPRAKTASSYLE